MTQRALIFDLDGTLTDSGEGVINCAQLALRHFGLPAEDREAMRVFVGPPLRESFPWFGVRPDQVEEAVTVFRSRYNTVGKYENIPYPGIHDLLDRLRRAGYSLYVGTSKPETTALDVLNKFHLAERFDRICGADMAGDRDSKDSVLRYLLETLPPESRALMVGDTIYDVAGAGQLGIPTVGVSWGYGSVEEMRDGGAVAIVDSPEELLALLNCEEFVEKYFG